MLLYHVLISYFLHTGYANFNFEVQNSQKDVFLEKGLKKIRMIKITPPQVPTTPALKITVGQRSLTIVKAFMTAEKPC